MKTLALALLFCAAAAQAAPYKVESVSAGQLTVDGMPAEPGKTLRDGAVLHLTAGEATLDFGKEGRLLLTGPADFTVEKRGLDLKSGGALAVLNRLTGSFSVATPAAVASVKGTNFYVEARGADKTYVCLCKGTLTLRGQEGSGFAKTITAAKHSPWLVARAEGGLSAAPAPMEHHTDAQIARLLKRGRKD